jgi:hypothetical protein
VSLYMKYTGWRQDGFNVCAYSSPFGTPSPSFRV